MVFETRVLSMKRITEEVFVRFISPALALSHNSISDIAVRPSPLASSTTIWDLETIVTSEVFGGTNNYYPYYTTDIHLAGFPIESISEHDTLADYDFKGTRELPLNLFVVRRRIEPTTPALDLEIGRIYHSPAWYPVLNATTASISTFLSSLDILRTKITDSVTKRRLLTALWQTTHFPPAVRALSMLFENSSMGEQERAVLSQTFQALAAASVPDWATKEGRNECLLEGSRQLIGWFLDQVLANKRGGSGKYEDAWVLKAVLTTPSPGDVSDVVSIKSVSGQHQHVKVEYEQDDRNPRRKQLAMAFRNAFIHGGNSYLVFPKHAGSLENHRILHHPDPEIFYELIINTNNIPTMSVVAPLSLSSSVPPVLTLNKDGLVSIFDFGGPCSTEWATISNPVTGTQKIMHNDQGQGLAGQLEHVIKTRKLEGAWALDGWDVGSLNASTIDTRIPSEAVIICIDASSSMESTAGFSDVSSGNGALDRMTVAKLIFKNYVTMTSNYRVPVSFGVMSFASTCSVLQSLTPLIGNVESAVESIKADGCTAMWACMNGAANTLIDFKRENPTVKLRIVLLSDGEDNSSGGVTGPMVFTKLWTNSIVLDAIVIGSGNRYTTNLFRICKVTGGYAFTPHSMTDLIQISELETLVDQNVRPPIERVVLLPSWEAAQPQQAFTVNSFQFPPRRKHDNEGDDFTDLKSAQKALKRRERSTDQGFTRRVLNEMKDVADHPHPYIDVYVSDQNMAIWKVAIQGPPGSVYETGTFVMFLEIVEDFPRKPPLGRFLTPILHPNVNKHGRICHSILDRGWTAQTSLRTVLCSVYGLLMTPETDDPVDIVATLGYWSEEKNYSADVMTHIKKYASSTRAGIRQTISGDAASVVVVSNANNATNANNASNANSGIMEKQSKTMKATDVNQVFPAAVAADIPFPSDRINTPSVFASSRNEMHANRLVRARKPQEPQPPVSDHADDLVRMSSVSSQSSSKLWWKRKK